ncbi:hypothetical protein BDV28DRAFT_131805 [Aspergillus coremiiformis]|uniref:Uncharacterized protein n=1 Tax=Aspergillus coremiiformis TaxID=138285 RepID=A0A5N6Z8R2_9EURO|nr:hypothetical protein BDV28DRAFT_131805 [Aspergillus coremiiformis]
MLLYKLLVMMAGVTGIWLCLLSSKQVTGTQTMLTGLRRLFTHCYFPIAMMWKLHSVFSTTLRRRKSSESVASVMSFSR